VRGVFLLGLVLAVTPAWAQDADKPEAQRLFEEGRKLLTENKFDAACAKFEASLLKDPRAVGTLLNLGLCKERLGKVASAVALFREAYDRAAEADLAEQRQAAQEHIASLTPQVPIVKLAFAGAPIAGTKLLVDDKVVPLGAKELPVDPGHHEVVMTAPGRLPYQTAFDIDVRGRFTLALPGLEEPKPVVVVRSASSRKLAGKVLLFGGVGIVVGASALAGYAWYRYDQLFEDGHCDANKICDPEGVKVADRSLLQGNIATVVGIAGGALAVTGLVLVLTAPKMEARVTPALGTEHVGVTIAGHF
jgi:tetratricopeptide (TPR) repeat protein